MRKRNPLPRLDPIRDLRARKVRARDHWIEIKKQLEKGHSYSEIARRHHVATREMINWCAEFRAEAAALEKKIRTQRL